MRLCHRENKTFDGGVVRQMAVVQRCCGAANKINKFLFVNEIFVFTRGSAVVQFITVGT